MSLPAIYYVVGKYAALGQLGLTKTAVTPADIRRMIPPSGIGERAVDFAVSHPLLVGAPLAAAGIYGIGKGIHKVMSGGGQPEQVQEPQQPSLTPEQYEQLLQQYYGNQNAL